MIDFLKEKGFENQERNIRGLLPEEMNHKIDSANFLTSGGYEEYASEIRNMLGKIEIKDEQLRKIDLTEYDKEPDYVFIVKKYGAPTLILELVKLGVIVKEFKCKLSLS